MSCVNTLQSAAGLFTYNGTNAEELYVLDGFLVLQDLKSDHHILNMLVLFEH